MNKAFVPLLVDISVEHALSMFLDRWLIALGDPLPYLCRESGACLHIYLLKIGVQQSRLRILLSKILDLQFLVRTVMKKFACDHKEQCVRNNKCVDYLCYNDV